MSTRPNPVFPLSPLDFEILEREYIRANYAEESVARGFSYRAERYLLALLRGLLSRSFSGQGYFRQHRANIQGAITYLEADGEVPTYNQLLVVRNGILWPVSQNMGVERMPHIIKADDFVIDAIHNTVPTGCTSWRFVGRFVADKFGDKDV